MNDLAENQFGTGGVVDTPDPRDFKFGEHIGGATAPFDWDVGYDVEGELSEILGRPYKIKIKDQGHSSSCGGQAWGYYGAVMDAITDKEDDEKSAKFIYSQTFAPGGGSAGRRNSEIAIQQGFGSEKDTLSYENGNPGTEAFMERPQDITQTARDNAKKDRAIAYANVPVDADTIAQAIRDNHGVVFGLIGENNGTWRTTYPKSPKDLQNGWRHWVFVCKAKMISGKKHFGFPNSWGDMVGDDGWQWISEDYLKSGAIWDVWTMIPRPNGTTAMFTRTLRYGMKGDDVKSLQTILSVTSDGSFGKRTLAAVRMFQMTFHLLPDGIVGPKTQAKLLELNQ